MAAPHPNPGSRFAAPLPALLLLLAAIAAPTQARGTPETRAGEKSAQNSEPLLSQAPQLLDFHREKATARRYDASGDSFAPKNAFEGLTSRANTKLGASSEAKVMASYLEKRIPLSEARPGKYLYTVDEQGKVWLSPYEAGVNHSSVLPVGANARVGGEMVISETGEVSLNTASGHYMGKGQQLTAQEIPIFKQAMESVLKGAGFTPKRILPDTTPVLAQ